MQISRKNLAALKSFVDLNVTRVGFTNELARHKADD
jgi:hypothetical protein